MIGLIGSNQVSLRHDMRTDQLTDSLAESDRTQVRLAQDFMTLSANVLPVGGNHLPHFLGGGDEASDIVQKCSQDDFDILAVLCRYGCQVGALQ
jgi:hypothetical protein